MIEFILRPFRKNDLESLVQHANNAKIAACLTNRFPFPYTEKDGKEFIEFALAFDPAEILAITIEGNVYGAIGIHPQKDIFRKNAELGYWLAEPYWGKGIMTRVIPQMVHYGFQNWDINRIFARPYGSNHASQRVLEKGGFVLEGRFEKTLYKNDQFEDELIYAIRRTTDINKPE